MKFKCKTCHKKFNVKTKEEVPCTRSDCGIRYNVSVLVLDFKGYEEALIKDEKVEMIEDFKSTAPKPTREMTNEQWTEWLQENGVSAIDRDDTNQYSMI